jgi:hypothetical protein
VLVVSAEQTTAAETGQYDELDGTVKRLTVMVVNSGSYTITRIEAQFKIAESLVAHRGYRRPPDFDALPDGLTAVWGPRQGKSCPGC